jgi:hypothetical protein
VDAVRSREMSGKPIEPEHKRTLLAVAERVRKSPVLVEMLKAHAAYVELMDTVQAILAGAQPGAEQEVEGTGDDGPDEKREEEPPRSSVLWTP